MDHLMQNKIIRVFPDAVDLFQAVVEDFTQRTIAAVAAKGEFSLVLSGGNTAKFLFDALIQNASKNTIPWNKIKFFFGDERYVPADDVESNYYTAQKYLFCKLAVPQENVYRMPTELKNPQATAKQYEINLRAALHLNSNALPKFDLVYLGLGADAHTASLMPLSDAVNTYAENKYPAGQLATSLWVPEFNMHRITLTPLAFNYSKCISFLVTGANKAFAVKETLEGPLNPQHYPAQLIHSEDGQIIWYLDQAAAGRLKNN